MERLALATNQLIALPTSIGRLESLKYFSVAENNLDEIPADIGEYDSTAVHAVFLPFSFHLGSLKNLESLYVNDNTNLQSLPYELGMCSNLSIMSIENCPLSSIPPEIVSGGPSLVIQYLRMRSPYH